MFFGQGRRYLVLGASKSQFKYGYKVLKWYVNKQLNVIPINPTSESILNIRTYGSVKEYLQNHNEIVSISVITPPDVSLAVFEELSDENWGKIKGVWFQPGSYNNKVLDLLKNKKDVELIADGNCILVSGNELLANI